jgi:hypothetical protein
VPEGPGWSQEGRVQSAGVGPIVAPMPEFLTCPCLPRYSGGFGEVGTSRSLAARQQPGGEYCDRCSDYPR